MTRTAGPRLAAKALVLKTTAVLALGLAAFLGQVAPATASKERAGTSARPKGLTVAQAVGTARVLAEGKPNQQPSSQSSGASTAAGDAAGDTRNVSLPYRPVLMNRVVQLRGAKRSPSAGAVLATLFFNFLKHNAPAYSNFATAAEKSGFNTTLAEIMQNYQVTILVPLNSGMPLSKVKYSRFLNQQLGFHIIYGYWDAKALSSALPGAKFQTCHTFPKQSSVYAFRLQTKQFQLEGTSDASSGAAIFQQNFFSDPNKMVIAHGITKLMTPYRYFN